MSIVRGSKFQIPNSKFHLPLSPGVYFFRDKTGKILYIGKAVNLKRRVNSYFQKRHIDPRIEELAGKISKIDYQKTDTVVEALILEANLINKHKPVYNIKLKDDKSFANIIITKEEFPRVLIARPTDEKKIKAKHIFGPYASKQEAEIVINLLVKIFDNHNSRSTGQLYRKYYIKGYSSGKIGDISKADYRKIIENIKLFLQGKKTVIIKKLRKEMSREAEAMNFEKAAEKRNQIFALGHIQDAAFIKDKDILLKSSVKYPARAEAYDISNISGKFATGSMVVFMDGKPNKNEYRKFKIKAVDNANDVAMLREMLERRLAHTGWQSPGLIIIDGGLGQKNIAKIVLEKYNLNIPIIAIAKGLTRKGEKLFFSGPNGYVFPDIEFIKKVRDEAHRFAVSYHRKLIRKSEIGY